MNYSAPRPTTADLEVLGRELAASLTDLIGADLDGPLRPTELRNRWKLEQTFCVRVCSALKADDPYATLYHLPAITNLRGLVEAARRRKVDKERVDRAEKGIAALKAMLDSVGGNKSHLDTLLSAHVPAAREKLVHASKQSIHHGMTRILGVETDAALSCYYVYPSLDDPDQIDVLAIYGSRGLKRLRPDLTTVLGGRRSVKACDQDLVELAEASLRGRDFRESALATALREFCTHPLPDIEVRSDRDQLLYLLPGGKDHSFSEIDLFFTSLDRGVTTFDPKLPSLEFIFAPRGPIKHFVFDVYLHESLWKPRTAQIEVTRGDDLLSTLPPDEETPRRLHCETASVLGPGEKVIANRFLSRHAEMMAHIREKMGWSADEFHLARAEVRYPVVGFRYVLDAIFEETA